MSGEWMNASLRLFIFYRSLAAVRGGRPLQNPRLGKRDLEPQNSCHPERGEGLVVRGTAETPEILRFAQNDRL